LSIPLEYTKWLAQVFHWSIPGGWLQYTAGVYQVAGSRVYQVVGLSIPLEYTRWLAGVYLWCFPGVLLEYTKQGMSWPNGQGVGLAVV
jgi:hypothetical protein